MKNSFILFFIIFLFQQNSFPQNVRMVKDLNPLGDGFPIGSETTGLLAALDTVLIFIAGGKGDARLLCRSDGKHNSANTLISPFASSELMREWVVSGGLFWFVVERALTSDLYSSDGSTAGTKLRYSLPDGKMQHLCAFQNGVVFHEISNADGHFLSHFDFSQQQVKRIAPVASFGGIRGLEVAGDSLIYGIGSVLPPNPDRYLFKATAAALSPVILLNAGSEFNTEIHMTAVGDKVFFFFQKNGELKNLWVTNGTAAGTLPLKAVQTSASANLLYRQQTTAAFKGKFVFRGKPSDSLSDDYEVWMSDGTAAGTVLLKDIFAGVGGSHPLNFTPLGDKLFFTATNSNYASEIWETDLSPDGTQRLPLNFTPSESFGEDLVRYQDSLAFSGFKTSTGLELMLCSDSPNSFVVRSDNSSPNGTQFLLGNFVAAGHLLYFAATQAPFGRELWVYHPFEKTVVQTQNVDNEYIVSTFPNPAAEFLNLNFAEETAGTLQIFAQDGKLVLEKFLPPNTPIPISNLSQGTYFLKFRIATTGRVFWGRFSKI